MARDGKLHLEDLSVGDSFRSSEHRLDAPQIKAFAASFDPQPFHTDEVAAELSFFQGLAASGWHTAAISMKLLVECLPFAGGVIGAGGEIRWPGPTRPSDRLHLDVTIDRITPSRSKPDRGIVDATIRTINQEGDVRQELAMRLLIFRRPVT